MLDLNEVLYLLFMATKFLEPDYFCSLNAHFMSTFLFCNALMVFLQLRPKGNVNNFALRTYLRTYSLKRMLNF